MSGCLFFLAVEEAEGGMEHSLDQGKVAFQGGKVLNGKVAKVLRRVIHYSPFPLGRG